MVHRTNSTNEWPWWRKLASGRIGLLGRGGTVALCGAPGNPPVVEGGGGGGGGCCEHLFQNHRY